jgi:hypothetical protein
MTKQRRTKTEKETKLDKKLKGYIPFIIGLGILVVIFIVLYFAFQNLGKVTYEGMTFTKEKYGEVLVYHYYYVAELAGNKLRTVDVFLRGNPAENNVPIQGEIIYPKGGIVYISINNSGLVKCEDSMIALASLTVFLANNNIRAKAGTPDKNESLTNNSTYIRCENYPYNTVIAIAEGNETRITRRPGSLCYDVKVSNCEILPALEKFVVQSIVDARNAGS